MKTLLTNKLTFKIFASSLNITLYVKHLYLWRKTYKEFGMLGSGDRQGQFVELHATLVSLPLVYNHK